MRLCEFGSVDCMIAPYKTGFDLEKKVVYASIKSVNVFDPPPAVGGRLAYDGIS